MKSVIKKIYKVLKYVLIVFVILVISIIAIQKISNNKLTLGGISIYTIISGSMVPEYEIGDMIVAKNASKEDLKVGDDVVYMGSSGDFNGKIVTHRIISMSEKELRTKGIANDIADPSIRYEQVYGKVIYKTLLLSALSKLSNNSVVFFIAIFVPFTIIIFYDILGIMKDKKALEDGINNGGKEE